MRAWTGTGRPERPLDWTTVDRPRPGPGEVLVAVEAFSINRGETFLLEPGGPLPQPAPGWRPGKDIAGTVAESGVAGLPVGTRVVGHVASAGWAEFAVVPVDAVAVLPAAVSTRTAAALPLAGLTALRVVRVLGSLAGKRVLLTRASGGVGHYLVELAAAQGALVTAVVSTPERGKRLAAMGAEIALDVGDAIGPFDVAIESVGGAVFPAVWSQLADGGTLLWLGQASRTPVTLDFFDWTGGANATLRKFHYLDDDRTVAGDLATPARLVEHGHLHPEIDSVRDWGETPDAVRALVNREVRGNVVLAVAS
ncbi:zinc-binding dehydrogenase [Pseudonocardia sp. GCM10023141]|uniref:zinc-binding dehydrogenase n=1 Tax=Pseudonocardia sp. GCM10023141 TaxID=3252653 RepID=UPI003623F1DE